MFIPSLHFNVRKFLGSNICTYWLKLSRKAPKYGGVDAQPEKLDSYTVKSKSIHSVGFGFSLISPSNLGQISKSGTVLKSTRSQLFKTVPDFEIWPRFDGDIEENPDSTEWIDFYITVE